MSEDELWELSARLRKHVIKHGRVFDERTSLNVRYLKFGAFYARVNVSGLCYVNDLSTPGAITLFHQSNTTELPTSRDYDKSKAVLQLLRELMLLEDLASV